MAFVLSEKFHVKSRVFTLKVGPTLRQGCKRQAFVILPPVFKNRLLLQSSQISCLLPEPTHRAASMAEEVGYCGHCGETAIMTCFGCGSISYCSVECFEADE